MNIPHKKSRTAHEVAARFEQLARQEKWFEIQDGLFADDVGSVEPPTATYLKDAEGRVAVRKKGEDWIKRIEAVHSTYTTSPVVGGNYFSVGRGFDLSVKDLGRVKIDEIMLYEVKDGEIVREQFFY